MIEAPEGTMKITKIICHYELLIPEGKKAAAERALAVFHRNCPVSQTLEGAVVFEHSWTIVEEPV